ncbi:MAG: hypothetical protein A2Y65_07420 [Deltaproteobacteria bacterium RBG_13_52_11]|nr:MAG: hypothetical protein A2Y65_07420 [Deltaproteobacteria bacterium RBG_13_52_11]
MGTQSFIPTMKKALQVTTVLQLLAIAISVSMLIIFQSISALESEPTHTYYIFNLSAMVGLIIITIIFVFLILNHVIKKVPPEAFVIKSSGLEYNEFINKINGLEKAIDGVANLLASKHLKLEDQIKNLYSIKEALSPTLPNLFARISLEELCTLHDTVHDCKDANIDSHFALSYIRSCTKNANLILSVDLELNSWCTILNDDDIKEARSVFPRAKSSMRSPKETWAENRFNDFNSLFKITVERLEQQGNYPPFIRPAPAILRTFVIEKKTRFEWYHWAVLKKLFDLEKGKKQKVMINKILFLKDDEHYNLRSKVKEQEDVILFFQDPKENNLFIKKHDKGKLPEALDVYGIRESLSYIRRSDREQEVRSHVLCHTDSLNNAYRYAMTLWDAAKEINPDGLIKRVES